MKPRSRNLNTSHYAMRTRYYGLLMFRFYFDGQSRGSDGKTVCFGAQEREAREPFPASEAVKRSYAAHSGHNIEAHPQSLRVMAVEMNSVTAKQVLPAEGGTSMISAFNSLSVPSRLPASAGIAGSGSRSN